MSFNHGYFSKPTNTNNYYPPANKPNHHNPIYHSPDVPNATMMHCPTLERPATLSRDSMHHRTPNNNPNHNKTPKQILEPIVVSAADRGKFQKLIEIIGYKIDHEKLGEFFDSRCLQSVICWKCCVKPNANVIDKIAKCNRQVTPYKCNHQCVAGKFISWRKKLTTSDGIYYEHMKAFKENMDRIRDVYQPSTKTTLNGVNTNTKKRKLTIDALLSTSAPARKRVKTRNNYNRNQQHKNINAEKQELENIIRVQRDEAVKIQQIKTMNEWYSVMKHLEDNNAKLNAMYTRIQQERRSAELLNLLPIIIQIKTRYGVSIEQLKSKFNLFANDWQQWNAEQIVYWMKYIDDGRFNGTEYQHVMNFIGNNRRIKSGKDLLLFNDLTLFLFGIDNNSDRALILQNVMSLTNDCNTNNSIKQER